MSSSRERQSERTSSAQSFLRRNNDHLNKQRETSNHSQSENNSRTPRSDPKQYHGSILTVQFIAFHPDFIS